MTRLTKLISFVSILPLLQASIIPLQTPLRSSSDDEDDTPLPLVIWHGLGDNVSFANHPYHPYFS